MARTKLKIKKTLFKRNVNGVKTDGYYGRVITKGVKSFEDVAEESSRNTSLHKGEVKFAAELYLEGASRLLKEGYIVDMGPLGRLYPSVDSVWHTDPDDVTLNEMRPKVAYRPSDDVKAAIEGARLGWYNESSSDDAEEPTETPSNGDNNNNTPDPDENILG